MAHEKTYFLLKIGKWRIELSQNYQYTDKLTGKVHMNKVFSIYRVDKNEGYQYWMSFYTGWNYPTFVYDTAEYEGNRHNINLSLGWGQVFLYLPWRNKKVTEDDINNPEPKYGFYLFAINGRLFDELVYYVNKDGHSDTRSVKMPWYLEFHRNSIYLGNGTWWNMCESERRKAIEKGIDTWNDTKYYLDNDSELIYKEKHPFVYITKSGEKQTTTATCFIEEMEWRRKWLRWTKLGSRVRTCLNITFSDEMGNERGTWKGGVTGVYADMTEEEKKNKDILSALRRYEERINRLHDYCR